MHNPDKGLGEKIRELRRQRGITQKDLAGEKITRNMLSLIESGNASPSVSTLLYIASRLDTPVGYFFSATEEDEARFLKAAVIVPLREQFSKKNYHKCQKICLPLPLYAIDDELAHILATSYLHTATQYADALDFKNAFQHLTKAEEYAGLSIYCTDTFNRALAYYKDLFRTSCSDEIADGLYDLAAVSEFVPFSLVQYFVTMKLLHAGESFPLYLPNNSYYERHAVALSLVMEERYTEGIRKFRELISDPALPYYMQYRVLSDLENAANTTGDVRLAYNSSRRKLELIEKFRVN